MILHVQNNNGSTAGLQSGTKAIPLIQNIKFPLFLLSSLQSFWIFVYVKLI